MTTTEVAVVNETAIGQVLSARKTRVANAVKYVETIPVVIDSDDMDDKAKGLILKYKDLIKSLNDERSPVTKVFDKIRSEFTADEKAVQDAIDTLSKRRDRFVADKAEKIKKANLEAQALRFKKDEEIDLRAETSLQLRSWVISHIELKKKSVLKAMSTITAENFSEKMEGLKNMSCEFDPLKYGNFEPSVVTKYGNNIAEITKEVVLGLETELLSFYSKEIEAFKHECIMQSRSLMDMNDQQRKEVLKDKITEVTIEASTATEVAQVEISQQTDVSKAEAAFTAIASHTDDSLPQNRMSVNIDVLNDAGWIAICQFWLATIAPNFKGNFETKTLKSMKGDVEKYAKDEGVMIESINLVYSEKIKAVN